MAGPDPPTWTAELVLRGLRLAFAREPRVGQRSALFAFVAERAGEVLGRNSLEYIALALRAASPAGALSIRELCRESYGWHRTRSELYRRSNNGAIRIAVALQRDGVPVPDALLWNK